MPMYNGYAGVRLAPSMPIFAIACSRSILLSVFPWMFIIV